eukprot:2610529-Rhodomonas_salina.1
MLTKVTVPGVGECVTAVDFVAMVCGMKRQEAQYCIRNMVKSKSASDVAKILCRKVDVPGFWNPTYVITYDECFDLLQYMPRHRVKNIRKHITSFFNASHNDEELRDTIVELGK